MTQEHADARQAEGRPGAMEPSVLRTFDGAQLVWNGFAPEGGRPRAVLAVVHGFGEHSGRYRFLVDALTDRGYALATFDLRGHGRSPGQRGYIERFSDYLDDTKAFLRVVRQVWPSEPLVLLGHSMGGLIAASYAERDQAAAEADHGPALDGLVLSSPFLGLKMKVSPLTLWSARILSRLAPRHSMSNGLRPEDLSHDPAVVAAARQDPLSHKAATARWATEVFEAQRAALTHTGDLRLPLLLMYAGDDQIADAAVTREFGEQVAAAGATVIRYDGYYHEIFNEIGRDRVFAELGDWLDRLTATSGSSAGGTAAGVVSGVRG